jgi:hypothetical protein
MENLISLFLSDWRAFIEWFDKGTGPVYCIVGAVLIMLLAKRVMRLIESNNDFHRQVYGERYPHLSLPELPEAEEWEDLEAEITILVKAPADKDPGDPSRSWRQNGGPRRARRG